MATPPVRPADIRAGHLEAIREANAAIDQAQADAARAAWARRALIAELHAGGMSYRQIAREVDMSQPRITQIMAAE